MSQEMIGSFIEQISSIEGVAACAIVTRDGIPAGRCFDRELNDQWLGALSGTILASAESTGDLIGESPLRSIILQYSNTSVIVIGAGDNFLIVAILKKGADPEKVNTRLESIAQDIGRTM
jgi:predicted regulator of Ras-like GTPase activity (Roadblock/LC7/MglB family)